jgi:hypothetical protein
VKLFLQFVLSFFVMSLTAAHAATFNFVYYYPPGGGTEAWTNPVIQGLQQRGHTVRKEFFKSCHEALDYARRQTDTTFIITSGLDILPTTAKRCPAQQDQPGLNFVTNISSGSFYLCTSPRKTQITLNDLTGNRQIFVGTTTNDTVMLPWQVLLNHGSPRPNVRLIPYYGQGELRAAAIAGTDIDLVYLASNLEAITSAGGICIASSTQKNHLNLPWLGNLAPGKFQDAYQTFDIWSFNDIKESDVSLLREIFVSREFTEFLAARPSFVHQGIGANVTPLIGGQRHTQWLQSIGLK